VQTIHCEQLASSVEKSLSKTNECRDTVIVGKIKALLWCKNFVGAKTVDNRFVIVLSVLGGVL
jgi:negative regulator of replication initiation